LPQENNEQITNDITVTCRLSLSAQQSQRTQSDFNSISAGSTVLTNHLFSTFRCKL